MPRTNSTLHIPDSPFTDSVGSALDAVGKHIRSLNKKLKAIDELKKRVERGDVLEKT